MSGQDESTEDQTDFQIVCQGEGKCDKSISEIVHPDFKGCEWCTKIYWDQFGNKTEIGPGRA